MSNHEQDITVVNIMTVSYSGSTWLNMLLGAHSEAFSAGEVDRVNKMGRPLCALHGEECPFWNQFDMNSDENPFVQINRISGKRIIIVKTLREYLHLQNLPNIRSKYLLLVRDGRAVMASILRKKPELSAWTAARQWSTGLKKREKFCHKQNSDDVMTVNYEILHRDTESELKKICDFIGMSFEPEMLEYWTKEMHYIGGSTGTISNVAKTQNLEQVHFDMRDKSTVALDIKQAHHDLRDRGQSKVDLSLYQNNEPGKFVDERWKSELTDRQLRIFSIATLGMNRKYGYPPALQRDEIVQR